MAFRLSARARRDLDQALDYSLQHYGPAAAARYELLLITAMREVGDQPDLPGSRPVSRSPGLRSYLVSYSRPRLPSRQRVRNPVHRLVYRVTQEGMVEILAIIGDSYPPARVSVP